MRGALAGLFAALACASAAACAARVDGAGGNPPAGTDAGSEAGVACAAFAPSQCPAACVLRRGYTLAVDASCGNRVDFICAYAEQAATLASDCRVNDAGAILVLNEGAPAELPAAWQARCTREMMDRAFHVTMCDGGN